MSKIGFIGPGEMGTPMARQLRQALPNAGMQACADAAPLRGIAALSSFPLDDTHAG